MHQQHLDFIKWAAGYDEGDVAMRGSRQLHEKEWMTTLKCPVIRIDVPVPTAAQIDLMVAAINRRLQFLPCHNDRSILRKRMLPLIRLIFTPIRSHDEHPMQRLAIGVQKSISLGGLAPLIKKQRQRNIAVKFQRVAYSPACPG